MTKVTSEQTANGSFPVAASANIKGGAHIVASQETWETEVPEYLRVARGLVFVVDEHMPYRISSDLASLEPASGTTGLTLLETGDTVVVTFDGEEVEVVKVINDVNTETLLALLADGTALLNSVRLPSGGVLKLGQTSITTPTEEDGIMAEIDGVLVDLHKALLDSDDNLAFAIDELFRFIIGNLLIPEDGKFTLGSSTQQNGTGEWAKAWADADGNVFFGVRPQLNDVLFKMGNTGFDTWLAQMDLQNRLKSAELMGDHNLRIARLEADICGLNSLGQSLGEAAESFPIITTATSARCLMIGESVRHNWSDQETWTPIGTVQFNTLTPTVEDTSVTPRVVMTPAEVALLVAGTDTNPGESPVGTLALSLDERLQRRGRTGKELCAQVFNVGGMRLDQLMSGASPNRFNQIPTGLAHFVNLADAASKTCEVSLAICLLGEADMAAGTDKSTWKANFLTYWEDYKAAVMAATGQKYPPVLLMYQTSSYGTITTENYGDIQMAQWELMLENDDIFMVGPHYQFTQRSIHHGPHGTNAMANTFAMVADRILLGMKKFAPLSPLWTKAVANKIYVGFHVPVPPLQFGDVYRYKNLITADSSVDKGFRPYDPNTETYLDVEGVNIVSDTIIEITCTDDVQVAAELHIGSVNAGGTNFGETHLCDSASWPSLEDYTYTEGTGQAADEDIAALVDQPYESRNFCIGGNVPAFNWSLT